MASHLYFMVLSREFPLLFACGNLLRDKAVGCDNNVMFREPASRNSKNQKQELTKNSFCKADKMHAQGLRITWFYKSYMQLYRRLNFTPGMTDGLHFLDIESRYSKLKKAVRIRQNPHHVR